MPTAKKAEPDYPGISITFLPNKIQVTISRFEELSMRRIQRSIREVYREYNTLKKRLIHADSIKATQPSNIEEKDNA